MPGTLYIKKIMLDHEMQDSSYLMRLPIIRYLLREPELPLHKPVTFLAGENGSGKSTLLEAIAISAGLNAEGGSRNFHFSTHATESSLHRYMTLARQRYEKDSFFLRAESLYNVASNILDLNLNLEQYGGKSLHEQSHGESFLSLIQNRFRGNGLYLLDEPESALSPVRQMTLLTEIKRLVDADSQFIIATHSPILLAYPEAEILELSESGIEPVSYEQTQVYRLTKAFLCDPDKMRKHLFG